VHFSRNVNSHFGAFIGIQPSIVKRDELAKKTIAWPGPITVHNDSNLLMKMTIVKIIGYSGGSGRAG
jgi:hypothetical protein